MSLLDDLVANFVKDKEAGGAGTPLNPAVPPGRVDPFPRGAQGELINPQYIKAEGERIGKSLAEGTYGNQPYQALQAARGEPQITIVSPTSPGAGQPVPVFEQSSWNIDPAQEMQDLRLDELRTRAAQHKMELEALQTGQPRTALEQAQLEHTLAATAALGSTEKRKALEDAQTMHDVSAFNEYMLNAPQVGTPEFLPYVRKGLSLHPRVATTAFGTADLNRTEKAHTIAQAIADAGGVPKGMAASSFHVGPQGASVTFSPEDRKKANAYGVTPEEIQSAVRINVGTPEDTKNVDPQNPTKIKQDNAGTHVAITTSDGKTKVIPTAIYEELGGKYSVETFKARQLAMARKAVNDPNSSEKDREAARKILSGL